MSVKPVRCPCCNKPTLVCWVLGESVICDECLYQGRCHDNAAKEGRREVDQRIVFSPAQTGDGTWVTGDAVEFRDLSRFIEVCMRRDRLSDLWEYLIQPSKESITALLDLAESRIPDPLQAPDYLATIRTSSLIGERIRGLELQINRLTSKMRDLEQRVCKLPDAARIVPLLRKTEVLAKRHEELKAHLRKEEKRLEESKSAENDLLAEHEPVVQRNVISRLWGKVGRLLSAKSIYQKSVNVSEGDSLPLFDPAVGREDSPNRPVDDSGLPEPRREEILSELSVEQIPWTILESAGDFWQHTVRHFTRLSKIRKEEYDWERLRFVCDQKPTISYVGKASFEGYIVFCFSPQQRAVLECPRAGNALYLMHLEDWESLSKLSKTELLHSHRREVSRIIHGDDWRYELELWIKYGEMGPLFESTKHK